MLYYMTHWSYVRVSTLQWLSDNIADHISLDSLMSSDVLYTPSPLLDSVFAMMIVWRLGGKIIRTVFCCVVYDICHSNMHTLVNGS